MPPMANDIDPLAAHDLPPPPIANNLPPPPIANNLPPPPSQSLDPLAAPPPTIAHNIPMPPQSLDPLAATPIVVADDLPVPPLIPGPLYDDIQDLPVVHNLSPSQSLDPLAASPPTVIHDLLTPQLLDPLAAPPLVVADDLPLPPLIPGPLDDDIQVSRLLRNGMNDPLSIIYDRVEARDRAALRCVCSELRDSLPRSPFEKLISFLLKRIRKGESMSDVFGRDLRNYGFTAFHVQAAKFTLLAGGNEMQKWTREAIVEFAKIQLCPPKEKKSV